MPNAQEVINSSSNPIKGVLVVDFDGPVNLQPGMVTNISEATKKSILYKGSLHDLTIIPTCPDVRDKIKRFICINNVEFQVLTYRLLAQNNVAVVIGSQRLLLPKNNVGPATVKTKPVEKKPKTYAGILSSAILYVASLVPVVKEYLPKITTSNVQPVEQPRSETKEVPFVTDMYQALELGFGKKRKFLTKKIAQALRNDLQDKCDVNDKNAILKWYQTHYNLASEKVVLLDDAIGYGNKALKAQYGFIPVIRNEDETKVTPKDLFQDTAYLYEALLRFISPSDIQHSLEGIIRSINEKLISMSPNSTEDEREVVVKEKNVVTLFQQGLYQHVLAHIVAVKQTMSKQFAEQDEFKFATPKELEDMAELQLSKFLLSNVGSSKQIAALLQQATLQCELNNLIGIRKIEPVKNHNLPKKIRKEHLKEDIAEEIARALQHVVLNTKWEVTRFLGFGGEYYKGVLVPKHIFKMMLEIDYAEVKGQSWCDAIKKIQEITNQANRKSSYFRDASTDFFYKHIQGTFFADLSKKNNDDLKRDETRELYNTQIEKLAHEYEANGLRISR